jgi:hypothetical protein
MGTARSKDGRLLLTGFHPSPTRHVVVGLVSGAPVGRCDGALLGPCWYRSVAVVGFVSRPPDRSQS